MSSELGTLKEQFFTEALDLVTEAEHLLLIMEKGSFTEDQLHALFRLFHTLKGNAYMVGLNSIGDACHKLETRLDSVRKGVMMLHPDLIQLGFEFIDLLQEVAEDGDDERLQSWLSALPGEGTEEVPRLKKREPPRELQSDIPLDEGSDCSQSSFIRYLKCFSLLLDLYQDFKEARDGEAVYGILMDMGMAAMDLRNSAVALPVETFGVREQYLEKFVTAMVRLETPYDPVGYELMDLLLEEMQKQVEGLCSRASWIREALVLEPMQFRRLVEEEITSGSDDILILNIRIGESAIFKTKDFFNQCRRIREKRQGPICFVHSSWGALKSISGFLSDELGDSYPECHERMIEALFAMAKREKGVINGC